MIDLAGVVLYVGKAKNLKRRVSSYFNRHHDHPKTAVLVSKIEHIEVIVTRTEHDALVLESQLIKALQPRYNMALKDDKHYPFLKITTDPFPRVVIARSVDKDGAQYFGPYPSIGSTTFLLRLLNDIFPIRDCKQAIDLVDLQPKCINLDIGRCLGPCVFKQIKPDYDALIRDLTLLLSGKNADVMRRLEAEMKRQAETLHFEAAAKLRDRLAKLEQLSSRQTVCLNTADTVHVWVVVENETQYYLLVQTLVEGRLLYQKGVYFAKADGDIAFFLEQAVLGYLEFCKPEHYPDEIWCQSVFLADFEAIVPVLVKPILVLAPQRGLKKTVLETAEKNATLSLLRLKKLPTTKPKNDGQVLALAQDILRLKALPERIIGFDISHLQGTDIVASAVLFKNGHPYKTGYRHFAIKSVSDQSNDPKSMAEVVHRRLWQCLQDEEPLPQLLLIDGGRTQLNAALTVIHDLRLTGVVEAVALAKRWEEIYLPGRDVPIRLGLSHPVVHLFQRVRDESHRFAGRLQGKKRTQRTFRSRFDGIRGLGPRTKQKLFGLYRTLDQMAQVTAQSLADDLGISLKIAEEIQNRLKQK